MRDLYSNVGVVQALAPAVQSATVDTAAIDLEGFEGLAFIIETGALVGAAEFSVSLQDSADGTTFNAVDPTLVDSNAPQYLAADASYKVGYRGFNRYVQAVLTLVSGTSLVIGVTALKGFPHSAPVA
ncbi:hypothetical protein [Methylocystis heyeri]|uniref:Uncharacterized protein n=1 Tax=Methylocystis heyeri TaxID=391905 RepID=A0A6B8KJB4_9HYPH|nr:hypothetical protein [Methylocystis heyeri]QGM46653.1 hypothetical protein H2LOC_013655 [Methylocystis heyeri]